MSPSILSNIRRNWRSLFGLALVMAVGPMCGSGGGGGGGGLPPAPTTFSVVTNFPAQNAPGIARTQTIYLTVNGVVDPATLTGNIALIGTNPIAVNLVWNSTLSQIEIRPLAPFMEQNTIHTVNVGAGVKTLGGASMVPKTFTFTTINSTDTSVPTFAGATSTTIVDTDTITVNWAAGSDPGGSAVGNLVYDVYLATLTGNVNFAASPIVTSAAGATSVNVNSLSSNTNFIFIVRCRDEGGNRDANTTERSGKTRVDFSSDIYDGIINNPATGRCTTCHRLGGQSEFMRMDQGASDVVTVKWVNVAATAGTGPSPLPSCGGIGEIRVVANSSATSLVWKKVAGTQTCGVRMPEDGPPFLTTDQVTTIADWINQGALDN